jgi:SH3 domain-containing YSC84-like protein 1
MSHKLTFAFLLLIGVLAATGPATPARGDSVAEDRQKAAEQAQKASRILDQIMGIEERSIPEDLLAKAHCVAVFPDVVKAAFIFGGTGGRGVVSCRDASTGRWSPPVFLKLGGASWGAQIGAESADFILVGLNDDSRKVFEGEEWTLDAEASAVAGPVGRKAKAGTDWKLDSKWLSYSRSKGLFAGLSLGGAKIKLDGDLNRAVYGPEAQAGHILMGHATADRAVSQVGVFPDTLAKYTAGVAARR